MTQDELKQIIQQNILLLLNDPQNGPSMRNLSSNIDCSDSYIQKVLSGKICPSLNVLRKISNYYDIPLESLITPNTAHSLEVQKIQKSLPSVSEGTLRIISEIIELDRQKSPKNPK